MNVSIIIATYGEETWAQLAQTRALPTAQAQDAYEVLIGHDPEGTIAGVRNALATNAEGDWLCFLDADDELAPGFLVAMERAGRGPDGGPPRLLTPSVQQIRNHHEGRPFFFPEVSLETGNWLIVGTLVERSLFEQVGGFEEFPHGLEDWQFWAKCVKAGAEIVKVPDAVYRAFYNRSSKHHQLARNRRQYMRAYEEARVSVWG